MTRPGSSEGKESPNGISMDDYNHPSPIQNSIHEPLLHDSSGHPHHASRAESFGA
ncbi:uncharacterized protein PGTG_22529 [Puccinia graminis f. sp. tritici CRL 75-36-700-3]|uniref:Uncharacterized protein n=1 Tax=Puccinia graminis f. sp. tritici (strain CRL 75-36-700-3 / race SCCL) TaxID=418459 RepID=H6QUS8_PUCGT|nr:uncharacterized protein PGTG_22529 [Puccinia graminis f. sp. tritici CRL 75-36-700-3]EHS64836.1 hypothetical protein PGTG_22529 [Puccinia graminis f. sp. tritici CRL 75-36-700-3]